MKTIKFILVSLFSLLSTLNINGQDYENALLWKITGPELESPSYLFGTIHVTCDATLNNNVLEALDQTKLLVLELDMDDPSMQMQMMKYMNMKDGIELADLVSEDDYTTLKAFANEELGMSVEFIKNMKPFIISSMMYPKLIDCNMQSFEIELMKVSKSQNEEVMGLETIEEQLSIFDEIPYQEQVKDLIKSAKENLAEDKKLFAKMMEIYNKQDIELLLTIITNSESSFSAHTEKLLFKRNQNWIPKIIAHAKNQPTFFGVGAAHLAGEQGVIALLRNAGYTIEAVN
jgi:uncharacterized protein